MAGTGTARTCIWRTAPLDVTSPRSASKGPLAARAAVHAASTAGRSAASTASSQPTPAVSCAVCPVTARQADVLPVREPSGAAVHTIAAVASLHALVVLDRLRGEKPDFTSVLMSLARVPGAFERAFEPTRWRMTRLPDCLICRDSPPFPSATVESDLEAALQRLGGPQ